jgi:hypothetical protein
MRASSRYNLVHFLCAMACAVGAVSMTHAQTLNGFTLINADNNQPISGYAPIAANATIDLATLPTRNLNIRADVVGVVGSVRFKLNGATVRTESTAPFAMYGDNSGDYLVWVPPTGTLNISATPYAQANAQGTAGSAKNLTLNVQDSAPNTGPVAINPASTGHLKRSGRFFVRDDKPVFIVGAGGPEGFLYESNSRKQTIVDELISKKINGIYFHALRAFGGDGNSYEHPFVSSSNKTIDNTKLQNWATYLDQLDQAGIVMWFALSDDHANPFGCFSNSNKADYESYVNSIVNAFKGYKNIIWVTQEEWNWTNDCNTSSNRSRQQAVAAAIRAADSNHAIAVHHMTGTTFQFAGETNIDVYGQQSGSNGTAGADTIGEMHDKAAKAGYDSNTAYIMAEAHPYHKNLLQSARSSNSSTANSASTELRLSLWALAMGGAAGMYVYDMYECHAPGNYDAGARLCSGSDAGADEAKPTAKVLDDMQRLISFMNGTRFNELKPLFGTDLSGKKAGGTFWMMSNASQGLYMLYSYDNPSNLGAKSIPAATYNYTWFDPKDGSTSTGSVNHSGGDLFLNKPAGIGTEAVVYIYK